MDRVQLLAHPKQIIEIRELIRKLAEDHTIILSSHILAEVQEVCDHIMIISKGKLVASDTPENLEKMMGNTEYLTLELEGTEEVVDKVLEDLVEELDWEIQETEEGTLLVEIETQEGDIRRTLSKALTDAGCIILLLQREAASLEDIFLELTESVNTEEEDEEDEEYDDYEDEDYEDEEEIEDDSDL